MSETKNLTSRLNNLNYYLDKKSEELISDFPNITIHIKRDDNSDEDILYTGCIYAHVDNNNIIKEVYYVQG